MDLLFSGLLILWQVWPPARIRSSGSQRTAYQLPDPFPAFQVLPISLQTLPQVFRHCPPQLFRYAHQLRDRATALQACHISLWALPQLFKYFPPASGPCLALQVCPPASRSCPSSSCTDHQTFTFSHLDRVSWELPTATLTLPQAHSTSLQNLPQSSHISQQPPDPAPALQVLPSSAQALPASVFQVLPTSFVNLPSCSGTSCQPPGLDPAFQLLPTNLSRVCPSSSGTAHKALDLAQDPQVLLTSS
jgi:hypothetical protein